MLIVHGNPRGPCSQNGVVVGAVPELGGPRRVVIPGGPKIAFSVLVVVHNGVSRWPNVVTFNW
jgi:hypothetical protein